MQRKMVREVYKARYMYLMIAPALIFLIVLFYTPVVRGFIMSLQRFRIRGGGEFIGLANYVLVFKDPDFWAALVNTLIIGGGTLLLSFVLQVTIALLLHEIGNQFSRRSIQTAIYMPHLFSWVVVGGIWISLLAPNGLINGILNWLGHAVDLFHGQGVDGPADFHSHRRLEVARFWMHHLSRGHHQNQPGAL